MIYLSGLLEMTPDDAVSTEAVMNGIIEELAADPSAFYQRTARMDKTLRNWSDQQGQGEVIERLGTAMDRVCEQLPEASEVAADCRALFQAG